MRITIEVDCNNDKVRILDDGDKSIVELKVKYPTQHIEVLEELLNILNVEGVILTKIDEDMNKTIGEW